MSMDYHSFFGRICCHHNCYVCKAGGLCERAQPSIDIVAFEVNERRCYAFGYQSASMLWFFGPMNVDGMVLAVSQRRRYGFPSRSMTMLWLWASVSADTQRPRYDCWAQSVSKSVTRTDRAGESGGRTVRSGGRLGRAHRASGSGRRAGINPSPRQSNTQHLTSLRSFN